MTGSLSRRRSGGTALPPPPPTTEAVESTRRDFETLGFIVVHQVSLRLAREMVNFERFMEWIEQLSSSPPSFRFPPVP